ncbi:MAG: hypothetical protein HS111_12225 [Kofleriaceae bacterium]|nr:hypothetical protein [Kofleriaceae bacterium]MCL4226866.1 hypothetical protein [Myxococcales bacterium]
MKHVLALGSLLAAAAGCGLETDERPASFSYLHEAILRPSCATAACHSAQNNRALVNLQDRDEALSYWNTAAPAERSSMYRLIGGETDPDFTIELQGGRMPLDAPLPQADILLIGRWLDEGAQDN